MDKNQVARPWPLSEGVGSLAARARIAGTVRSQGDAPAHPGSQSGPAGDVQSIGPGALRVATRLN